MSHRSPFVLIADANRDFSRMLADEAGARGYRAHAVVSVDAALEVLSRGAVDLLFVDLAPDGTLGFELLTRARSLSPGTELVVMSDRTSMAAAVRWIDPDAYAVVRKSDIVQLFTVAARALERRRLGDDNRRLVWELQTINRIAAGVARSLDLDDVLGEALSDLVRAMRAAGGSIDLVNRATGALDTRAVAGEPAFQRAWFQLGPPRPSSRALAARALVVEESPATEDARPRSTVGVPLVAGDETLGALSLGWTEPRRLRPDDERLLSAVAGHLVVAVENARLHEAVRGSWRDWEETFDAIDDPIGIITREGELLRGNRALARHVGLPVTALAGLPCTQTGFWEGAPAGALCGPEAPACRWEAQGPDGSTFSLATFPMRGRSAAGSVVMIARRLGASAAPARRAGGRAAEEGLRSTHVQLLQAEKLSAIGQLAAGVAHELNNPLTSVIGYAQLLEAELDDPRRTRPAGEIAADLRRIAEEAARAARIVRDLLAFSRRHRSGRAREDLAGIVSRVLALRQYDLRLNGVELHAELPAGLPAVLGDAGGLQAVVLHLVLNAEQAMRESAARRLSVVLRASEAAGAVELTVADTGHGIDPAHLFKVFDPFFTTRDVGQGVGLGLSVCYGTVRDHGGEIRIDSTPGAGTTIRVLIPARLPDPGLNRVEALVAHPDDAERNALTAAFSGWGYRTLYAGTPAEALKLYARRDVRVAVLDGGVVTPDLARWRGAHRPEIANVFTSAPADDHRFERYAADLDVPVLRTPVGLAVLRAATQVVERAGGGTR